MQEKGKENRDGIGFLSLLFLVFLVLKLTNVIDWSWWWVTAPLWIPLACVVAVFIICASVVFIATSPRKKSVDNKRESKLQKRVKTILEYQETYKKESELKRNKKSN